MEIIRASDFLKCKLLSSTFKEELLRWYMGLPLLSFISYQDFVKNLVHQFATTKNRKTIATSLFNIRQDPSESLREYLAHFNEVTINVVYHNQEMLI